MRRRPVRSPPQIERAGVAISDTSSTTPTSPRRVFAFAAIRRDQGREYTGIGVLFRNDKRERPSRPTGEVREGVGAQANTHHEPTQGDIAYTLRMVARRVKASDRKFGLPDFAACRAKLRMTVIEGTPDPVLTAVDDRP